MRRAGATRAVARLHRIACVVLALVALAGCTGRDRGLDGTPDVVLIVADALRADRFRDALEGGGGALPHLARLAEDGVVYERATSPGTWCLPAYGSLLTGRWPSYHGAERRARDGVLEVSGLDAEAATLAEILHERGVRTAAFLPGRDDLAPGYGLERGFGDFVNDPALASPSQLAGAVARWIGARSGPVFLLVGIDDLRTADAPDGGERRSRAELTNASARHGELPWELRTSLAAAYDGALARVDRAVGEILAVLQADGRYADALIVVTADHGELLGEHGLAGHGWPPFEETLNVPLVVKYPQGRDAGRRVARRVSTLGVFATVLETVGIARPDDVQARPLDAHHPVWAEDVDRRGRRVRAGYDGLREKIIRVVDEGVDVACSYDMYMDRAEMRPDCRDEYDSALRRAMASFASRPRPGEPESGLARAPGAARAPAKRTN